MSTLRSLRLLNAVESGTVNSTQLQSFLTDAGRASEFSVLLASRGQSRRMAGSTLTMAAIVNSPAAIDIVFKSAKAETSSACQAVVVSPIAMNSVSNSRPSLLILGANNVSWGLFNASTYYEVNVRTIIANYANVNPASYPTVASLIIDPVSMADISAEPFAMSAVVASPASTTLMASNSSAMSLVASNPIAIDIVAKQTSIMGIIASSTSAMTEIISRSTATNRVSSYPGAITAISKVPASWASFLSGQFFASNIALIVANLAGISPTNFPTLASIIADATSLALVAKNTQAVQALASNTAAMNALAISPNIGIILSSSNSMAVIGPNTSAMSSFLNASGAWAGLFASSVAKGYIVTSTALVDIIATNSALITYLGTMSVTASATGIPDGVVGAYQPFAGIPAKVLTLSAKEVGIAATFSPYKFGGSPMAGTQAGRELSLTAASNLTHIAGYTGMTWDLQGIGVTAATLPIIKYVDMT